MTEIRATRSPGDRPPQRRRSRSTPRLLRPQDATLLSDGRLNRSEQLRIMAQLLPPQTRRSIMRFFFMLTLSVAIAVMGLAENSTAVVIGAMLIAPLMTPIMAFAAAVGLGLGRRAAQAVFLVVLGSAWAVAFGYLLAKALPEVQIGSEIIGRTRPDVRDLIVAVAAGAAGAYAIAREEVSAALPGVAVAVALVPPLATTGILIEAGQRVLAEGAGLLFLTNLLAIIVSALVVLLATGVIPTIRLVFHSARIALTAAGVVVATVLVAIPLTARSLSAASSSRHRTAITDQVAEWVGALDLEVNNVDVSGQTVRVELTGPDEPPPAYELATRLVPLLGNDAEAVVRWDQRAQGVARADRPPAANETVVAKGVVDSWIDGLRNQGLTFDVIDLTVTDDKVDVVLGGASPPPRSVELSNDIADALGRPVGVTVRWIQQFNPGLDGEPPVDRLQRFVRAWIGPRSSVRLIAVSIDGSRVSIDLGADGTPLGLSVLRDIARTAVVGVTDVEIRTLPLTVVVPGDSTVAPAPPLD